MIEKTYFEKLKKELVKKFAKDELANLLVKRKDQRVSNLICAAYNLKILGKPTFDPMQVRLTAEEKIGRKLDDEQFSAVEHYRFKKRTIGSGTWANEVLYSTEGAYKYVAPKDRPWAKYVASIGGHDLSNPEVIENIWLNEQMNSLKNYDESKEKKIEEIIRQERIARWKRISRNKRKKGQTKIKLVPKSPTHLPLIQPDLSGYKPCGAEMQM